jgi:membrane protein YqaA with SNARE-associated domain
MLVRRLRRKLAGILPLVACAAVLAGLLSVVLYIGMPSLDAEYRRIFEHLQNGDWVTGRQRLRGLFDSFGSAKVLVVWNGLWLSMAGLTIGSCLALLLGRGIGEHIVRRLVPRAVLAKFDFLIDQGSLWSFFMLFLLPALPDDAICLIAGLTRLPIWKLMLVCVLGRLPGMAVLSFVGAHAGSNLAAANVVIAVTTILAAVLWLFSEEAEASFSRLSKKLSAS